MFKSKKNTADANNPTGSHFVEKKLNVKSSKTSTKTVSKTSSEKARSGNPALRGEVVEQAKKARQERVAKAVKLTNIGPNKDWLVPTFLGLMILGISWIVIFYLTASIGGYPIPALAFGNLGAGFFLIIAGFVLTTKWK